MQRKHFLKDHFSEISDIIIKSWQHKKTANFKICYNDKESRIDVNLKEEGKDGDDFEYHEKNHSTMESFFDDLNTDICIVNIRDKYPKLGIEGCSGPQNIIYINGNITLNNLSDFFSPKDGIFHIHRFLQEKNKLESSSCVSVSAFSQFNPRSLNEANIYPKTCQSEFFISITPNNMNKI